jgi:hypothetical protein
MVACSRYKARNCGTSSRTARSSGDSWPDESMSDDNEVKSRAVSAGIAALMLSSGGGGGGGGGSGAHTITGPSTIRLDGVSLLVRVCVLLVLSQAAAAAAAEEGVDPREEEVKRWQLRRKRRKVRQKGNRKTRTR